MRSSGARATRSATAVFGVPSRILPGMWPKNGARAGVCEVDGVKAVIYWLDESNDHWLGRIKRRAAPLNGGIGAAYRYF